MAVNAKRRLAAVVVADVVGYSKLVGENEASTVATVNARWETVLKPIVHENGGRVVKFLGDGALMEFSSAVDAVRSALAIQNGMAAANESAPDAPAIQLRIGINLGDVISDGDDIFGDDVNIAARLEGVARPGELCVSQSVHDAVRGRLAFEAEEIGDLDLKNIAKSIRAFRLRPGDMSASTAATSESKENRLSIAVLPFDNMSGVPEHDFIGEGMSENILTDLARFKDLTVIARNSSFAYKGRAARVQDIRRELGANYVLEGSIQKAGDRIRVNAQLIDGVSGKHVWAERYDRKADDLFAVMDDITELIVATLATTYGGRLRKAAAESAATTGPTSFPAFDSFVQGMVELNKCTEESVERAGEHFSLAIKANPRYAKAHAKSCWVHIYKINFGWTEDAAASLRTALQFAEAAVAADDSEAWGYWAIAGCDMQQGRHDRAISGITRAVELNPNDADVLADMGLFLSYVGRADEGIPFALKANRINPNHPEYYDDQLGQVFFTARRYEDAVRSFEGIRNHITAATMVYLAASHAALGNMESAGATVKELLAKEPASTIAMWTSPDFIPYKNPEDVEHLARHLRAAGVPG
ncbi:adenylate/guanylate cyclase domain-containing protein [Rhizobium sp. LjRoot254]|uniref:adenylate/guanylate cyclase domain-containing protein n=1 Tax=Rhizobium sp. LjRoot254 TaxID=3342297 RepID=UPI003ECC4179